MVMEYSELRTETTFFAGCVSMGLRRVAGLAARTGLASARTERQGLWFHLNTSILDIVSALLSLDKIFEQETIVVCEYNSSASLTRKWKDLVNGTLLPRTVYPASPARMALKGSGTKSSRRELAIDR